MALQEVDNIPMSMLGGQLERGLAVHGLCVQVGVVGEE